MDIVEVSPPYDHAETTSMIANRAALEAISALAVKKAAGPAVRFDAGALSRRWPAPGTAEPLARRPRPPLRRRPRRGSGRPRPLPRARRARRRARSSSSPRARAGSPSRWRRPATRSPRSTSIRRCSRRLRRRAAAAGVAARGGLELVEADLLDLELPARRHVRPGVHRPELAVPARDPRRPARRRSGRSPRISRRAASPSSTSGCPTPTTSPASTAG